MEWGIKIRVNIIDCHSHQFFNCLMVYNKIIALSDCGTSVFRGNTSDIYIFKTGRVKKLKWV